ncbi:hypothetical protein [Dactylosporangium sp. CA-092794]|uniref:hypothetical protein n=1 Tax=Dactylosporangium sp. CA-092794 TaxID=3239929 RepID=UPI003D8F5659
MVWWRKAQCPVRPVEQEWIERSMDWLLAEFGRDRLLGPVVLPNDDWFPGAYRGTAREVEVLVGRLCDHMGVAADRIEIEHFSPDIGVELTAHVPLSVSGSGAAGHHRMRAGRSVIAIREDLAARPMELVATVAHELGHARLLAEGRVGPGREDHEPLTDLLTVFFGLGIFGANAAFDFSREVRGDSVWTSTSRLGYLTEPMFGYGLARYAWLRDEPNPAWARYLDTNPRSFLNRGLRYLTETGGAGGGTR